MAQNKADLNNEELIKEFINRFGANWYTNQSITEPKVMEECKAIAIPNEVDMKAGTIHHEILQELKKTYSVVIFDSVNAKAYLSLKAEWSDIIFAVGVTPKGIRHFLGYWCVETSNKASMIAIMSDLLDKGLNPFHIAYIPNHLKELKCAIMDMCKSTKILPSYYSQMQSMSNYMPYNDFRNVRKDFIETIESDGLENAHKRTCEAIEKWCNTFPSIKSVFENVYDNLDDLLTSAVCARSLTYQVGSCSEVFKFIVENIHGCAKAKEINAICEHLNVSLKNKEFKWNGALKNWKYVLNHLYSVSITTQKAA